MENMGRAGLRDGFTIVELLIVIVIIGILAALVIIGYNGVQDRANASRVSSDLASLSKAIQSARELSGRTLLQISNHGCTRCTCPYAVGDTTDYSTLPKTHTCWTRYVTTLVAIENAGQVSLSGLKNGDPWGSPYAIDENEGEGGGCANRDMLWSFGKGKNYNASTSVPNPAFNIPFSGFTGCS